MRDFELRDGRADVRVPVSTVNQLRANLRAIAQQAPAAVAVEIQPVIEHIDRSAAVAELLASRLPPKWAGDLNHAPS